VFVDTKPRIELAGMNATTLRDVRGRAAGRAGTILTSSSTVIIKPPILTNYLATR
jgi:hypothetical protein